MTHDSATMSATEPYEAILLVSFGGPEGPDDVLPFLENVTRGRGVPTARLRQVAEQYLARGGVSPINAQCRALRVALERELEEAGHAVPVYWGNRNWHPMLADTVARMAADGVRRALAVVTSAFGSYSGCRQYLEDIRGAQDAVGATAPAIDKVRIFYDHPGFIEALADNVRSLAPAPRPQERLVFTAHSLPLSMAHSCRYEQQLHEAARLVSARLPGQPPWDLVFQSRSGPPAVPWLEPDVSDHLRTLAAGGVKRVVLAPLGFVSDHMEVVYDLDVVARETGRSLGMTIERAATVGTHPRFVRGLRELIEERLDPPGPRRSLAAAGAAPDFCPPDCCPAPRTQSAPTRNNR